MDVFLEHILKERKYLIKKKIITFKLFDLLFG